MSTLTETPEILTWRLREMALDTCDDAAEYITTLQWQVGILTRQVAFLKKRLDEEVGVAA